MKLRILSAFAAVALLAACETAPQQTGTTGGAGAGQQRPALAEDSLQYFQQTVGDRVFFDYDRYDVRADGRATLEKQAAWLKKFPQKTITVEGHADERGTREYNLALGERRANAVKDYLVSLGIPASRVKTVSYGKERPVALGSNEAAWAQNRRGVTLPQ